MIAIAMDRGTPARSMFLAGGAPEVVSQHHRDLGGLQRPRLVSRHSHLTEQAGPDARGRPGAPKVSDRRADQLVARALEMHEDLKILVRGGCVRAVVSVPRSGGRGFIEGTSAGSRSSSW